MFKLLVTVSVFLQFLLQTECLYSGDVCVAEGASGTCVPLRQCQHIFDEVRQAGNPIPPHMREKLQKLTCGFESNDPLVCCASSGNTANQKPATQNVILGPDTGEDIEAFTRATLDNKNGPIGIDAHPNLGLLPKQCGTIESDRINGGNRTELYEMPWMVLLYYDSARGTELSCGGTLINEWYVLTAAHCVNFLKNGMRLGGVVLGEYDTRQDPDCETSFDADPDYCAPKIENVSIAAVVAHPGFTPQTLVDDIALIRLARPANFTLPSMKPLCLPISQKLQTESLFGQNVNVAGWGVTEDGLQSPVLLSVELPVISTEDCTAAYKGFQKIRPTQICAGGVKGKDSCGGDSGGPLMYPGTYGKFGARYVQRGIVSYGTKRCGVGFPGVYTHVAYYMNWILDNMHS